MALAVVGGAYGAWSIAASRFAYSTFDDQVPRSEVLYRKHLLISLELCDNIEVVRLPEDAPAAPTGVAGANWGAPSNASSGWDETPIENTLGRFAKCNLPQDLHEAITQAQSAPGSWVLSAQSSWQHDWLYSAPYRIAVRSEWGD